MRNGSRMTRKTEAVDRFGLSAAAGVIFLFLLCGYEVVAHGVGVDTRAFVTMIVSSLVVAWMASMLVPDEL